MQHLPQGDEQECKAVRNVFGEDSGTLVNNTKVLSVIRWERLGQLNWLASSFQDGVAHGTINVTIWIRIAISLDWSLTNP